MITVALFFLRCHFADGFGQPAYRHRESATAHAILNGPSVIPTMDRLRYGHPDAEVRERAARVRYMIRECGHCSSIGTCPAWQYGDEPGWTCTAGCRGRCVACDER